MGNYNLLFSPKKDSKRFLGVCLQASLSLNIKKQFQRKLKKSPIFHQYGNQTYALISEKEQYKAINIKFREQSRSAVKYKTAPFSLHPNFPMRFHFIQTREGKIFPGKGISMNYLSPQINFSPVFFLCLTYPLSQLLCLASSEALCVTCLSSVTSQTLIITPLHHPCLPQGQAPFTIHQIYYKQSSNQSPQLILHNMPEQSS